MKNAIIGFIAGAAFTVAYIEQYGQWFRGAANIIFALVASGVFGEIILALWLYFRDKQSMDNRAANLHERERAIEKEAEARARTVAEDLGRMKNNLRHEYAGLRAKWNEEREGLIQRNRKLEKALRSKWNQHRRNIAENNPGRAARMAKQEEKFLKVNSAGQCPDGSGRANPP